MYNVIIALGIIVLVCIVALVIQIRNLRKQNADQQERINTLSDQCDKQRQIILDWFDWAEERTDNKMGLPSRPNDQWAMCSDLARMEIDRRRHLIRREMNFLAGRVACLARKIYESSGKDLHETRAMCRRVRSDLTEMVLDIACVNKTGRDKLMYSLAGLPEKEMLHLLVKNGVLAHHSEEQKQVIHEFIATGTIRPTYYMTTPTGPS